MGQNNFCRENHFPSRVTETLHFQLRELLRDFLPIIVIDQISMPYFLLNTETGKCLSVIPELAEIVIFLVRPEVNLE